MTKAELLHRQWCRCLEAVEEASAAGGSALAAEALDDVGGAAGEEAAGREDAAAAGETALAEAAPVDVGHAVLSEDVAGDLLIKGEGRSAGNDESEEEEDLEGRREEGRNAM